MTVLYFWLGLLSILPSKAAIYKEALNEALTEEELAFYFQTADRKNIPEYDIVELPVFAPPEELPTSNSDLENGFPYSFIAFQRPIDLYLKRNDDLLAINFKTYLHDDNGVSILRDSPTNHHYLHEDGNVVASISITSSNRIHGLIFLENSTLEVQPLTQRLHDVFNVREPLLDTLLNTQESKIPHLIKRATFSPRYPHHEIFPVTGKVPRKNPEYLQNTIFGNLEAISSKEVKLTLEVALFFDEAAYKIFAPFYKHDPNKLQDMLLAYMNAVQALYHHPSLGRSLELVVVRLDLMKKQPGKLPHYNGERGKLLDTFCDYQASINPKDDGDPDHWDVGLYVSGLDFFAYENGKKSGVTMGLATVGGVCLDKYSCVIAEFGTTNAFGKPYPSAGFTSVYILAHEIGHSLGMHHDNNGNSCPKEGYIMSPSRGTNGETQWSTCSANVMADIGWAKCLLDRGKIKQSTDHRKYLETPGQKFTAKTQCEILLRDRDAVVLPSQDLTTVCYNLQCKTPHRSGYYFAGPALEGTSCGKGKYCYGGSCLARALPQPVKMRPGGWGAWQQEACNSGCIEKSLGFTTKRRRCDNPPPLNSDLGCEGSSVKFALCLDNKICKTKKVSAVDYASNKCLEFSKVLAELDPMGSGLQAPHEEDRLWMGCSIFCRRADSGTFYTPRIELNDLGISPYFPDGTWCHRSNNINYYCLQHHCLPENFEIPRDSHQLGEDLQFLQNADPWYFIPQDIKDYLSVDSNGKPIKTTFPENGASPRGENWDDNDYIEIPDRSFNPDENLINM
ncbi:unnamed protein product [Phyllotreta striolata]|uniref:ADAMTS cysteine-rich domain-containing protein n=1 Tax=Phyllotreta striolata TaxID=444603 RepID=A0A9N9TN46_PHYSR|nr:unnamed protein product [Phyllotreta striolata]